MVKEGSVEWFDRDLEARRHLWMGLKRMTPSVRVAFLAACCRAVSNKPDDPTDTAAMVKPGHSGTVHEAYFDLCYAAVLHGLSLLKACELLERWLKREA